MNKKRIVITGMAINTPIGDTLDDTGMNLLHGKSSITRWRGIDAKRIYSKIGGDLFSFYDEDKKLEEMREFIPFDIYRASLTIFKRVARATKFSILMALDAWSDAQLFSKQFDPYTAGVICSGGSLNWKYALDQYDIFRQDAEFIDGLAVFKARDHDHVSSVSEILNLKGGSYHISLGCAVGNIALNAAINEILNSSKNIMIVLAPAMQLNPFVLQLFSIPNLMTDDFRGPPEKASRPYDKNRTGFVPSEGGAVLILEDLEHAKARGASIYCEILGAYHACDSTHFYDPSVEVQSHVMSTLLKQCEVEPHDVDYLSAHAPSSPAGDITEIQAIKKTFGKNAYELLINAPKSLLGNTFGAASIIEGAIGIWQMHQGTFHQSHNIDTLDESVDLNVCAEKNVKKNVNIFLNNSFALGGMSSASLFGRYNDI